jgi:hypothetical protein
MTTWPLSWPSKLYAGVHLRLHVRFGPNQDVLDSTVEGGARLVTTLALSFAAQQLASPER